MRSQVPVERRTGGHAGREEIVLLQRRRPAAIVQTGAEPPLSIGPPVTRPGTERRLIGLGIGKRLKKDRKEQKAKSATTRERFRMDPRFAETDRFHHHIN